MSSMWIGDEQDGRAGVARPAVAGKPYRVMVRREGHVAFVGFYRYRDQADRVAATFAGADVEVSEHTTGGR